MPLESVSNGEGTTNAEVREAMEAHMTLGNISTLRKNGAWHVEPVQLIDLLGP